MPVRVRHSASGPAPDSRGLEREIARLRAEVDSLRRQKPDDAAVSSVHSKLPLVLAGLALLVAVIALFR